jgi:autophagy-related protein 9
MHSSHRSGRASPNDSIGATSPPGSRPFLNLLNPIGRHYHGYSPASVVEEDSENDGDDGTPTASVHRASRSTPRVQMNDLQPSSSRMGHGRTSAGGRDGRESSDDEVPQSFMIEANPPQQTVTTPTHSRPRGPLSPTAAPSSSKDRTPRNRPNRRQDSVLPLHAQSKSPQADSPTRAFSSGLNARERALWNWVNVYNLDAYLQDVSRSPIQIQDIDLEIGLYLL